MLWTCRLLGGLSLEGDGRRIERFRTEKTALLLGYLAYHAGEWFERVALADLFWGDGRDPDASLRTALSSLRRQLEPAGVPTVGVLQTAGNRLRLNPDALQTDAAQFQALLQAAQCSDEPAESLNLMVDALRLYRGELLQGYEAEWLVPLRTQLEREYIGALQAAAPALLRAGRIAVAQELAERAVRIYPLNETVSEWLIRLYLSTGATAQAEAEYQRLQSDLARALGDYPRFTLESLRGARFEVGATAQPTSDSTPVKPPRARASVPAPLTRFFGREAELARAARLLQDGARLVTITGAPGIGKTRLGQELGARLESDYAGRVFWASLREAHTELEVRRALAHALGCDADTASEAFLEALAACVDDTPALLITDNWEHALDAALLLVYLLQRAPRLQAIALSRHPLEVDGEHLLTLEPLPTPEVDAPLDALYKNPAVALFIDRARSVRPDFALTESNAPKVVQLCCALEGAPLALELAAAQLGAHSLSQLLQTLNERLDWLVSRRRDVGYPYRSLQAALESSYALLTPPLQRALAQLATLQGEWDEPLANAVLGKPAAPVLDALTRHSLLQRRWDDDTPRYQMLESVRLFALRKGSGRAHALHNRLFSHFERLGGTVQAEFNTSAQSYWLQTLRRLYLNLQEAMEWGVEHAPARAARMLVQYGYFLDWEHRWDEARRWCVRMLNTPSLPQRARAQLLSWLGLFLLRVGQYAQAETHLRECIQICCALRDWDELAGAYDMLGLTLMERQRWDEATEAFEAGVAAARRRARPHILAPILHNWGILRYRQGRYEDTLKLAAEANALYAQIQTPLPLANTLNLMGVCYAEQADYNAANRYFARAAEHYHSASYAAGVAKAYNNLADVALRQGELQRAAAYLQQAWDAQRRTGSLQLQGILTLTEAQLAHAQGRPEVARERYAQCLKLAETVPSLQQALEKWRPNEMAQATRSAAGRASSLRSE
ncbi:MAG: tetratricopeptide repeat protein [Fimbriimonadales bacterium]|nr:tetratricopeptide repeat protein [Fimbriimonadales bacterium]